MPRTLPWATGKQNVLSTARPTPSSTPGTGASSSRHSQVASRSTTLSPDEEPIVEYMRPEDDRWVMVEDELLSTAQLFTRSIRLEEYQHLALEATNKNAHQIFMLQRPVIGTSDMSGETIIRREIAAKQRLQRQHLDKASYKKQRLDDSEDDDDSFKRSELHTLMRGESFNDASLGGIIKRARVATRAAAGMKDSFASQVFIRSDQNRAVSPPVLTKKATISKLAFDRTTAWDARKDTTDDDEDDLDLDAPVLKQKSRIHSGSANQDRHSAPISETRAKERITKSELGGNRLEPPLPPELKPKPEGVVGARMTSKKDELLDLDLFPPVPPAPMKYRGKSAARRAAESKARAKTTKEQRTEDFGRTIFSW